MENRVKYVARMSFGYCGRGLDPGQVLALQGSPNDHRLIHLGYLIMADPYAETHACAECGAEFTNPGMLTGHTLKRHAPQQEPREEVEEVEEERAVPPNPTSGLERRSPWIGGLRR